LAKQNFIPFNPAADLELPKLPRQLPKAVLSIDDVGRILQQPDVTTPLGLRDRAIFEVLYSTGMRRQEVCRLRLDHIYVDRQVLFVSLEEGAEGSLCTDRLARLNMDRALHAASTAPVLARFNRADIIFNGGWHTHSSRFVDRIWTAILKGGWG
jgi:site-specific recombinase XerD